MLTLNPTGNVLGIGSRPQSSRIFDCAEMVVIPKKSKSGAEIFASFATPTGPAAKRALNSLAHVFMEGSKPSVCMSARAVVTANGSRLGYMLSEFLSECYRSAV